MDKETLLEKFKDLVSNFSFHNCEVSVALSYKEREEIYVALCGVNEMHNAINYLMEIRDKFSDKEKYIGELYKKEK